MYWSPREVLTRRDITHAAPSPQHGLPLCSGDKIILVAAAVSAIINNRASAARATATLAHGAYHVLTGSVSAPIGAWNTGQGRTWPWRQVRIQEAKDLSKAQQTTGHTRTRIHVWPFMSLTVDSRLCAFKKGGKAVLQGDGEAGKTWLGRKHETGEQSSPDEALREEGGRARRPFSVPESDPCSQRSQRPARASPLPLSFFLPHFFFV